MYLNTAYTTMQRSIASVGLFDSIFISTAIATSDIIGIMSIIYAASVCGTALRLLPEIIWIMSQITNIAISAAQPKTNAAIDFEVITLKRVKGRMSDAFNVSS